MMHNPSPSPYNMPSPAGYNMPSPASSISTVYSPGSADMMNDSFSNSHSGNQPRQRLRPWLTDQINLGKTPGLEWVNKEQAIFKIPWKHFGRPGVDEYNDAMLFRNWALHTKKWQEGQPTDISTWKTRFRCALTKLQDIVELNHMHQTEGDEPYRVYQFKEKGGGDKPASNVALDLPQIDNNVGGQSPMFSDPGGFRNDFNTGQFPDINDGSQFSSDLDLHDIESLDDIDLVNNIITSDTTFNDPNANGLQPMQQTPSNNTTSNLTTLQANNNSITSLSVTLFYANQEVNGKVVDNPRGLRIAFNPPPPLPEDVARQEASEVVSHIYGPFQAEQIYFPPTNERNTMRILEWIKRGLVLQARNGEILATRLCRAKVFYSDSMSPSYEPKELPREHTTVVFDYANDFLPKFRAYMLGQGPLPSTERYFSFGQKCSAAMPMKNIFIYVAVNHLFAQKQISQFQNQRPDILVSDPNMLDIIANQIEELSVTGAAAIGMSQT